MLRKWFKRIITEIRYLNLTPRQFSFSFVPVSNRFPFNAIFRPGFICWNSWMLAAMTWLEMIDQSRCWGWLTTRNFSATLFAIFSSNDTKSPFARFSLSLSIKLPNGRRHFHGLIKCWSESSIRIKFGKAFIRIRKLKITVRLSFRQQRNVNTSWYQINVHSFKLESKLLETRATSAEFEFEYRVPHFPRVRVRVSSSSRVRVRVLGTRSIPGLEPWKSSILVKLRQNKGKFRVISAWSADFFDFPPFILQFFFDFWIFPRGKGGGKVPQVPQWRAARLPLCLQPTAWSYGIKRSASYTHFLLIEMLQHAANLVATKIPQPRILPLEICNRQKYLHHMRESYTARWEIFYHEINLTSKNFHDRDVKSPGILFMFKFQAKSKLIENPLPFKPELDLWICS